MQSKIVTKCSLKKNNYKIITTTTTTNNKTKWWRAAFLFRGCGMDPKIKVIALFKNKKVLFCFFKKKM